MSEIDKLLGKLSRQDRDNYSYDRDSQGLIAKRAIISNTGTPVEVEFAVAGETINVYSEVLSLAASGSSDVLTYSVPVGKEFRIKRIEFSGTNRADYIVKINNITEAKRRSYYTNFDGFFEFYDYKIVDGDILKIVVNNNNSNSIGDFNCNLQGNLRDA